MLALACALVSLAAASSASAQDTHAVAPEATTLVAGEMVSQYSLWSYFSSGSDYIYEGNLPSSMVAGDAPERTVKFGDSVTLAFAGLDPKAVYAIELVFLSDSATRTLIVSAANQVIEPRLWLPKGKILQPRYLIPATAFADGKLTITIGKVAAENAVISGFRLYSSNSAKVTADTLPQPPPSAPQIPRYTPRPMVVAGTATLQVDLGGVWKFNPSPAAPMDTMPDTSSWKTIEVPGEWAHQGFDIPKEKCAEYVRTFIVPQSWANLSLKLKCDAAFSDSTVWINGKQAGRHIGGFTPFEYDVTSLVHPGGQNTISIAVTAASISNTVASAMGYAARDLGGISRKIYLFAVPKTNLADVYLTTTFDSQFRDAILHAQIQVSNDSDVQSAPLSVALSLRDPAGHAIKISAPTATVRAMPAGQTNTVTVDIPVSSPEQWDPEHPNLYSLECSLSSAGHTVETLVREFGFRQVEVRGNQLFVNNHAVKLRGSARHEIDPIRGRSQAPGTWLRDVGLFREANVNSIRTSHYPPAEELIAACNKLGMFVEEEAPVCWANANQPGQKNTFVEGMAQTVMRDRSDPSVIIWSLGNETTWGPNFESSQKFNEKLDNSRPFVCENDPPVPPMVLISTPHYPGLGAPARYDASPCPVIYGEYAHLTCYDRTELSTDPGLRDIWGEGFSKMWESMLQSRGTLGGNIWAGIDETVFEADGKDEGYGPWGFIDGWRRKKPEYFYVKKVYSPIRMTADAPGLAPSGPYRLALDNRSEFSNLSEIGFHWSLGKQSGWAKASVPPHSTGMLNIDAPGATAGTLHIDVISQRGFTMDSYDFPVGPEPAPKRQLCPGALTLTKGADQIKVECPGVAWTIDAHTGMIVSGKEGNTNIVTSGPYLMTIAKQSGGDCAQVSGPEPTYAPAQSSSANWKAASVAASQTSDGGAAIHVEGSYDNAKGSFTLSFDAAGHLKIAYDFAMTASVNVWEMGIALDIARPFDTLSWQRKTSWSGYAADDIGRPIGVAKASGQTPIVGPFGPRTKPDWAWSQDNSAMGTNDFRSAKWHVINASLSDPSGIGLDMISDGSQIVRTWLEGDHVKMFAIDFANQGSASFVIERLYPDRRLAIGNHAVGQSTFALTHTGL